MPLMHRLPPQKGFQQELVLIIVGDGKGGNVVAISDKSQ
jgi:hypothetical protein